MKYFLSLFFLAFSLSPIHAQSLPAPATADSMGNGASQTTAPEGAGSDDYDKTFTKVEVESEFPGGLPGWSHFLATHLKYPEKAVNANIEGTVVVQFIVDKQGRVSNVKAISGPELLREAAANVIKQSSRWNPAIQSGRKVRSYKRQPITFKLEG
jgi:protein TonB